MADTPEPPPDEWPPKVFYEILDAGITPQTVERMMELRRAKHPKALEAILEDARVYTAFRSEKPPRDSKVAWSLRALRLCWKTESFLALALYRVRSELAAKHVPVVPHLLNKLSVALAQVSIGDPVVIEPGIYIPHGQVVIDGLVDIGKHTVMAPWVGIGLEVGHFVGARVSQGCYLATGSKIIGPVKVGPYSQVAANSVVIRDVPERTAVAGSPARVVGPSRFKVNFPRPGEEKKP